MKKLKTKIFIFGKKSHNAEKKLKGGTLWDFSTSILSQNIKKNAGGALWGKFFSKKKSHNAEKTVRGSRPVLCYAKKKKKPIWLSSLDQMVQCDTIKFRRTFEELFWSVGVD